jgi:hypothetical protein
LRVTISGTAAADFLRLVPLGEISDQSYEVTASLGGREVSNGSVSVVGVPAFLTALAGFADTRSGRAVLEGTYDFRLTVSPYGRTGAAWIGFVVAEFIWLGNQTHGRHLLDGGLVVDGEQVGQLVGDLSALLAGV